MKNKIPNSDIIGYEGPVGHEKAIHKLVHPAPGVKLVKRKNGDIKRMNGTLYIWKNGKWNDRSQKDTQKDSPQVQAA